MKNNINILLINGPNLNLLGTRETEIYGDITLPDLLKNLEKRAKKLNMSLKHIQSNAEHVLIDKIHSSRKNINYIIINPAAFTHTSIAIRDALIAVEIPFIEIHISNIYSREDFRSHSWLSDISQGVICGLGLDGYHWALETISNRLIHLK
ncbi:type II 3-dehydroquinate dehydratase [Buchnera aphidicola str. APS (Acyrthosiphon pisum)]|uniref:3-dehydroquinate dehydratase n=3 Tax=Buchnera aphidicola TaxID=9 RepID=AROQ_BUCAI|nr:type II 3-dehydroquinate dehydratase [Buchnera aphidicola]B8D7T4.1 RecName: Full=3-dehydroquinate dehydratase; Short=3-dehydroquinase; AltName: Full=Type II DHQase [Buchnera aphidicola str. Tuc7 (Acyrthosiphon pisum)]B8D9I2.1 RecName: Full=3-dehydroquinate dehydratase; Short=3-dehydroquinase; AltName: Full=Type II DHQase [Buchnera aphidicola str. 5A (Acyrthosiphon pisum)]P57479.1 RecName: Full=3-dehydroquinate dehydratase; Short=3-dehydroquinase; AltName: Full=Type II DHQase [Buchnera aphidic